MTVNLIIVLIGLFLSAVLFYRFPVLSDTLPVKPFPRITVVIPARNEEHNLPLLLDDLKKQTVQAHEIICVDDASTDNTASITRCQDVKLISLKDKPAGWIGKSLACQRGADEVDEGLILFLDADVRLGVNAIRNLVETYNNEGCVISVQPYHTMVEPYEQFSMFFNLVQFSANGVGFPIRNKNIGLNGPVILISGSDYRRIGGHESVRKSIIDDIALGESLKQNGIPFKVFLGDRSIAYRMYGSGFKDLLQGWIKNQASGAMKTPFLSFLAVFLWFTSCTSIPIQIIRTTRNESYLALFIYALLYVAWILVLWRITRHIGDFSPWAVMGYPVLLGVFLAVFAVSFIKKIFGLKVVWKNRLIGLE